jgi:HNH endonuclease
MTRLLEVAGRQVTEGADDHQAQSIAVPQPDPYKPFPLDAIQSSTKEGQGDWLIPVTGGQWAIVSAEDFPLLSRHSWALSNEYPSTNIGSTCVPMHRFILPAKKGSPLVVDHINRNKLDNRRENLRLVHHTVNTWNRGPRKSHPTGVVGVQRVRDRFVAKVTRHHKLRHLGTFDTLQEAKEAIEALDASLYGGELS